MESLLQDQMLVWSLALVLAVPLLVVLLTEIIERFKRQGHPLAGPLRWTRNLVLPLLALVLLLRYVVGYEGSALVMRLAITLFLLAGMLVVFRALAFFLTPSDERASWRNEVPELFLQLPRFLFVLLILYLVLAQVWSVDVAGLITAFGIGSLVIALALQDTLSNLFSGLLLLISRPFKEGEWIRVGTDEGRVWEINWRNTTIRTRDNDLVIIPNGNMAKNSFKNFSRPTRLHRLSETFDFDAEHPPNQVLHMLYEAALDTPGVLAEPEPDPRTVAYQGASISYKIFMWIEDYGPVQRIRNRFMTSVYYHAQREGLSWPRQEQRLYLYRGSNADARDTVTTAQRAALLQGLPGFAVLPDDALHTLAAAARLLEYGEGERILQEGEREQGLYVITEGTVGLGVEEDTQAQELTQLHRGDLFGETGLFGRAISAYHAFARTDVWLLRIPHATVNAVINNHPRFASEMNTLIEQRRKLMQRARPAPSGRSPNGQVPG